MGTPLGYYESSYPPSVWGGGSGGPADPSITSLVPNTGSAAAGPISVQVILGKVRIHLPDDRMEDLDPGDLLTLERCLEHDVEALEESAFLLTIAWPEVTATDHA